MTHATTARVFVGLQLGLLVLLVAVPGGDDWSVPRWLRASAMVVAVAGAWFAVAGAVALGRELTPSPIPRAGAPLRTDGVYGWVRHPIYTGLVLLAAGFVAATASVWRLAVLAALVVLLDRKAHWEEARLRARFAGYAAYAEQVPRFVPRPGRLSRTGPPRPPGRRRARRG